MPDKKFELGDYVEVKDRIKLFFELYASGRLVTSDVQIVTTSDGTDRVMVTAKAYRTVDDPLPGVGTSWLALPGSTPYTRGSEVENAETSAWGRAIGSLGILIDRSIASANEIENKAEPRSLAQVAAALPPLERTNGGLIGIAALGKSAPVDGQLRQTPDGPSVGFVIGEGRDKVQVVAYGPRAEPFAVLLPGILGQRVTVFGSTSDETMKVGQRNVSFVRVRLSKLVTPEETMNFGDLEEPPDDVPLVGEAEPLGLVG